MELYTKFPLFQNEFHSHSKKCPKCDSYFDRKSTFLKHYASEHRPFPVSLSASVQKSKPRAQRPYVCHICNNAYARRNALQEHLLAKHEKIARYKCTCGKKFKWRSMWRSHMNICKGEDGITSETQKE